MKTIERREIQLADIVPHAHNREFPTKGEEWAAFVDDVEDHGILVELVVREQDAGQYECLQGHRRRAAGLEAGVTETMCRVVAADDEEAFELLWAGNLHRLNPDPVDESRYVRGMMEVFGYEVAAVAARLKRSVEWVRTRQRLLDLGEEVVEAVRQTGAERLSMGAVEEILRVPEEWWPEAVQLVLHPVFEPHALSEGQARDVLRRCLVEPKADAAAWEGMREKLGKTWRKTLEKFCLKGTRGELAMQVRSLAEAAKLTRGFVDAEERVGLAECLPGAPEALRWLHLAVKHGLAVQVVPGTAGLRAGGGTRCMSEDSRAVVDAGMVRDAEAAAAEYGGEAWLVTKKRKVTSEPVTDEDERRSVAAQAVLNGEGEPGYDGEGRPETVIEQGMEHHGWLDLGAVKRVSLWSVSTDADPMNAPEFVPKWARKLAMEGLWPEIDQVVDWVLSLKRK